MGFSFADLNLSGVQSASSESGLTPGYYLCKIEDFKIEQNNKKTGYLAKVKYRDVDSGNVTYDNITVAHTNQQATEIGLQRLKLLLESAGHPNPNNPGKAETVRGLYVGVAVDEGDTYTKDGETKKGPPKPRKNGPYFKPEEQGFEVPKNDQADAFDQIAGGSDGVEDDDIPFN